MEKTQPLNKLYVQVICTTVNILHGVELSVEYSPPLYQCLVGQNQRLVVAYWEGYQLHDTPALGVESYLHLKVKDFFTIQ